MGGRIEEKGDADGVGGMEGGIAKVKGIWRGGMDVHIPLGILREQRSTTMTSFRRRLFSRGEFVRRWITR